MRSELLSPLPHSREAEGAVLGAILLDNEAIKTAQGYLTSDDFFSTQNRLVFRAMLALVEMGQVADLVTVTDFLQTNGQLETAGGPAYVSSLVDGLPRVSNAGHYAKIIKEKSARRQLMRDAEEIQRAAANGGQGVASLLKRIDKHVAELNASAMPDAPAGLQLSPIAELLGEQEEEVQWVVGNRLPAGGFSILAGKPKAGKSTFARCLALAVSHGESFLGWSTSQGSVIYLALEEKRSEVRKHFLQMGARGDEQILIHAARAPQDALTALRKLAMEQRPVLVIVDTLLRLVRVTDGNDYAQVTTALEPVLSLARETGSHLLAVHHLSKGERSDPAEGILGSTAFFATVDTALILKRTDRYRTLATVQRYGEDLPETVLHLDPEHRVVSLGAVRSDVELHRIESDMLACVEAREDQLEKEIMEATEGRLSSKREALRSLVKAGKLVRAGTGRRGDPFRYSRAEFLFSRSPDTVGTRERETENGQQASQNQQDILVPKSSEKSAEREQEDPTQRQAISEKAMRP